MDSGERNESCRNGYHQSSERISAEPGDQASDLLFSSQARYRLNYGNRLKCEKLKGNKKFRPMTVRKSLQAIVVINCLTFAKRFSARRNYMGSAIEE